MAGKGFTHLHLHTQYSLLDGAIPAGRLFASLQRNWGWIRWRLPTTATCSGSSITIRKARDAGVKPIHRYRGVYRTRAAGSTKQRRRGRG